MEIAERVIDILKDGKWHSLGEICQNSCVHESKLELLANFLADYSFLDFRREEKQARLSKAFIAFIKDIGNSRD